MQLMYNISYSKSPKRMAAVDKWRLGSASAESQRDYGVDWGGCKHCDATCITVLCLFCPLSVLSCTLSVILAASDRIRVSGVNRISHICQRRTVKDTLTLTYTRTRGKTNICCKLKKKNVLLNCGFNHLYLVDSYWKKKKD